MTPTVRERLAQVREQGGKALIPYLMSGFPTRARFRELATLAQDEGADVLEVGVPFSDPLADGPVIQAAGQVALEQGTTVETALEDAAFLRDRDAGTALLLMGYANPLLATGYARAARRSRRSGISAWIVPDRDVDRSGPLREALGEAGVDLVPLVAPTTPEGRLPLVLRGAGGFVYLVSVTGVTGARQGPFAGLAAYVARVRRHTDLPLCVGFGIAGGSQARQVARHADGVIVGSALLEPFLRLSYPQARREMQRRLRDIRRGLG